VRALYNSLQLSLQVRYGFGIHSPKDGSKVIEFPVSVDGGRKEMRDEATIVFYVDDNAKSRTLLTSILRESGFEVITASDPLEALGVCKEISFDLALLDQQMPKMTGSQLAQEIKFLTPDIPIVLISGKGALPPTELAFVDAHFGSGTTLDELLDGLRTLVRPKLPLLRVSRSNVRWADST
jgi:CheY-like chemotaxis protein